MLNHSYDTLDEIPESLQDYYQEGADGRLYIQVRGMKSDADFAALQNTVKNLRKEVSEAKAKVISFNGVTPEDVENMKARLEEASIASGGAIDESKMQEMVELRLKREKLPLERTLKEREERLKELEAEYSKTKETLVRKELHDTLRSAAIKAGIKTEAIPDVLRRGEFELERQEDGSFVTKDSFLNPEAWAKDLINDSPHYFHNSTPGGATGSFRKGGIPTDKSNPFHPENTNMTERALFIKANTPEKVQAYKDAVGGN